MSPRANLGGARKATERQGGLQRSSRYRGDATQLQGRRQGARGGQVAGPVVAWASRPLCAPPRLSRGWSTLCAQSPSHTHASPRLSRIPPPFPFPGTPPPHSLSPSTFAHACACTSRRLCFRPALATPPVPRPRSPPALLLLTHCVPQSQKSWRRRPRWRVVSVLQTKLFARAGLMRAVPSAASVG